jgi:transposase-like protein
MMMTKISYGGYRFPPEIIQQAIWLYVRFTLSFRDVEDLLAERGILVSYETVRRWVNYFGPVIAADLRKRRPKTSYDLASRRSLSQDRWSLGLPLACRGCRGRSS